MQMSWTCKSCHQTNPIEKFVQEEEIEGLLCPNCYLRHAWAVDKVDHWRCADCNTWSHRNTFRVVRLDRRGDREIHCPKCNSVKIDHIIV